MVDKRMVRNTSEERDVQSGSGGEHPENSSLLAFLRGQQLEDSERIRLHLIYCTRCRQTYANLSHISQPLDILSQMSRYQRYPELSSALILRQIQQGAQKQGIWSSLAQRTMNRPRPKKSAVRLVSLPVAFGIGLLCMTVIIVLAYTFAHFVPVPPLPGVLTSGMSDNQPSVAGLTQHQPTPSPTQVVTAMPAVTATTITTSTVTGSPTPTTTPGKSHQRPSISDCSARLGTAQYPQVICGSNFKPGDRVTLKEYVFLNKLEMIDTSVTVDANGKFTDYLKIISCKATFFAFIAEDTSSNPVVDSNTLWESSMGDCPGSNQR